jgi:DNA repair protein RadD
MKGNRVLILVHRVELLEQASRALDATGVSHGLIAAGRSLNLTAPVQVASVQTLASRLGRLPPDLFQLCIADEAHHTPAASWAKVLRHFAGLRVLGVTATPCRSDGRGLSEWYDEMVIGPSAAWLTEHGYLAPARVFCPDVGLETAGLRTRMGDFDLRGFDERAGELQIMGGVVEHFQRYIGDGTCITFCCSVAHAQHQAEAYRAHGIPAASIDGTMTTAERRELLADLGTGRLRVLTSCALIGEGVDVPSVTGCQFLRPTKSLSLHLQMVGRALRPQPGKTAILLDHVGNFTRPGLGHHLEERQWTLDGAPKSDKKSAPSVKECPQCSAALPSVARVCAECGYVFPVQEREIVYVGGELRELTGEQLARHRARKERGRAQTYDELVLVAISQGMKNPNGWARHVLAARSLRAGKTRVER